MNVAVADRGAPLLDAASAVAVRRPLAIAEH
jgi:hypothetical protein